MEGELMQQAQSQIQRAVLGKQRELRTSSFVDTEVKIFKTFYSVTDTLDI
jgi:hypothetical protein